MAIVKIVNTSPDKPLHIAHDSKSDLTIPPGKHAIVEQEYATIAFGNPGARNEGVNRVRESELKKLYTRYGYYPGLHPQEAWQGTAPNPDPDTVDAHPTIGPLCPSFEVYDMEDNRIYMILDDPEGTRANPVSVEHDFDPDMMSNQALSAQVQRLQGDLERALQLLSAGTSADDTEAPVASTAQESPARDRAGDEAKAAVAASIEADAANDSKRGEDTSKVPAPRKAPVRKDAPSTSRTGRK